MAALRPPPPLPPLLRASDAAALILSRHVNVFFRPLFPHLPSPPLPASNVCATVDSLNLGQYLAPLSPVVSAAAKRAGPLLNKASEVVLPHISPYLDLAAPYIGGAKPHLDKVSQTELIIIVGTCSHMGAQQKIHACVADPRDRHASILRPLLRHAKESGCG